MPSIRHISSYFLLFAYIFLINSFGQYAVPANARYYRLICLVHLVGSGKASDAGADPLRPEYVPTVAAARNEILAWRFVPTDDGKMAIVQVVAADRSAFAAIRADNRPEVRIFEIGKDKPAAIEAEMRKYKKNFSLDDIQVSAH
jgi:hypothetical protein